MLSARTGSSVALLLGVEATAVWTNARALLTAEQTTLTCRSVMASKSGRVSTREATSLVTGSERGLPGSPKEAARLKAEAAHRAQGTDALPVGAVDHAAFTRGKRLGRVHGIDNRTGKARPETLAIRSCRSQ